MASAPAPSEFNLGKRLLLHDLPHAAAGTDPDRTRLFNHGQQRRGETTDHGLAGIGACHAVGNNDEVHRVPSWCHSYINGRSSLWFLVTIQPN